MELLEQPGGYFVHETARVDAGAIVGPRTKVWHFSHVLSGAWVGSDCVLGQNVMVAATAVVGDRCKLQNNVSVYDAVTLADGVFVGPSAVFTNVLNPRAEIERKHEYRSTQVGRGASIGANATIVCGHRLGAWSMVGAGAVVTGDIPDHALVLGVPAVQVGWVSRAGHRLDAAYTCPVTGQRHEPGPGGLREID